MTPTFCTNIGSTILSSRNIAAFTTTESWITKGFSYFRELIVGLVPSNV